MIADGLFAFQGHSMEGELESLTTGVTPSIHWYLLTDPGRVKSWTGFVD